MFEGSSTENAAEGNDGSKLQELMARYGQTMIESGKSFRFDVDRLPLGDKPGSELFRVGIEMLEGFVDLPIATDELPHEERRAFRKQLRATDPAHHALLEENKIRWNHVGNIQPALELVRDNTKDTDLPEDVKHKVETLIDETPKLDAAAYAALSTAEKIAHVKEMEWTIMVLFAFLEPRKIQ